MKKKLPFPNFSRPKSWLKHFDTYAPMPVDLLSLPLPAPTSFIPFKTCSIFLWGCGDSMKAELLQISSTPHSKILPDSSLAVITTFCAKYSSSKVPIPYTLDFRESITDSWQTAAGQPCPRGLPIFETTLFKGQINYNIKTSRFC